MGDWKGLGQLYRSRNMLYLEPRGPGCGELFGTGGPGRTLHLWSVCNTTYGLEVMSEEKKEESEDNQKHSWIQNLV